MRYAYSYDREDFVGSYATEEEAFAEGLKRAEGLMSPPTEIFIGTLVEADPQAGDHAQAIVEAMNQRAHVDFGESAARYLRNVTPEQVRELDGQIQAVIVSWLKKHKLMPTFVRVRSIRECPVPYPGNGRAKTQDVEEAADSIGS